MATRKRSTFATKKPKTSTAEVRADGPTAVDPIEVGPTPNEIVELFIAEYEAGRVPDDVAQRVRQACVDRLEKLARKAGLRVVAEQARNPNCPPEQRDGPPVGGQPHQRLRAAEQHRAAVRQQRVLQPDFGAQQRVRGQRGVHPVSPVLVLMPDDSRDRCR